MRPFTKDQRERILEAFDIAISSWQLAVASARRFPSLEEKHRDELKLLQSARKTFDLKTKVFKRRRKRKVKL